MILGGVGRCCSPQSLVLLGSWRLSHHTGGRNTEFIMDHTRKGCNRTRSDIIVTPADKVSVNNVAYMNLLRGNDDIFGSGLGEENPTWRSG